MMLRPANVLALDEPTNHLDIPAREVLEAGARRPTRARLLVVSHDRYFLDQVCTRLLVMEDGGIAQEAGNYSDWKRRRAAAPAAAPAAPPPERPAEKSAAAADWERRKLERNERERLQRRLLSLEDEIAALEARRAAVQAELAAAASGWQRLQELAVEERTLEADLAAKLGEWEQVGQQLG